MHGPARVGMKRSVCRVYCVLQRPHFFAPQRPPLRRGGTSPLLPAFRQPFTASLQFFSSAAPQPTATPSVPPPTARRPAAYPALVSFLSTQPSDTHSLAAALAAHCKPGDVLLLYGGVGEGKTELARGFLRAYTGVGSLLVTSPTYTVMLEYAHAGHRSARATYAVVQCCLPSSVPSTATDVKCWYGRLDRAHHSPAQCRMPHPLIAPRARCTVLRGCLCAASQSAPHRPAPARQAGRPRHTAAATDLQTRSTAFAYSTSAVYAPDGALTPPRNAIAHLTVPCLLCMRLCASDVSLIEWPERLTEVPPHALSVRLEKLANDRLRVHHSRVITLSAHTEPWRARIEQWKAQGLPGLTIHTTPPR